MTSEKEDATSIAIPFVISGDLPLVLIVAMILADNASMGASDRATRNVPNILDESDPSAYIDENKIEQRRQATSVECRDMLLGGVWLV